MKTTKQNSNQRERNIAFGARLKAYRKQKDMSQLELAGVLGRTSETISKIERGLVLPGLEMLLSISQCLDVSLDQLMNNEQEVRFSAEKITLITEAKILLSTLDEKHLKVAVKQLKTFAEL